jgi:hypothetical protein
VSFGEAGVPFHCGIVGTDVREYDLGMLAVEMTTATLVAWGAAAVLVGFALGWALRPWVVADRVGRRQAEALETETDRRTRAEADLAAAGTELGTATTELTAARGELVDLRQELSATGATLADTQAKLEDAEARAAAATAPR